MPRSPVHDAADRHQHCLGSYATLFLSQWHCLRLNRHLCRGISLSLHDPPFNGSPTWQRSPARCCPAVRLVQLSHNLGSEPLRRSRLTPLPPHPCYPHLRRELPPLPRIIPPDPRSTDALRRSQAGGLPALLMVMRAGTVRPAHHCPLTLGLTPMVAARPVVCPRS